MLVNPKVFLIFSGYNDRGILSFCRFCDENSISFNVVAVGQDDPIYQTSYAQRVIFERNSKLLKVEHFTRFRQIINDSVQNAEIYVLPSSEFLNRFLLKNRDALSDLKIKVPLCESSLYKAISDKKSFGDLCRNFDITVPNEYGSIEKCSIPFVAKPKKYLNDGDVVSSKPILIKDSVQLNDFLERDDLDDFFYQDFIKGESYYLLCYFSADGSCYMYSQKNFIQQGEGLSIIAAKSSCAHSSLNIENYKSLFISLGFVGLIMIEVRVSESEVYMIEANPRIWGPSQLVLDSNMTLFHHFVGELGFQIKLPQNQLYSTDVPYFWLGGWVQDKKQGRRTDYHGYTQDLFMHELHSWLENDVYLREDSISQYLKEILNNE